MKKMEIIIKPEKLEDLKELLEICEYHGVIISNIMGFGNQRGQTELLKYRGDEYPVNLLPKVKVECVILDDEVDRIVDLVCKEIRTGNYGDGKMFVMDVEDAVRIRTGERGETAL